MRHQWRADGHGRPPATAGEDRTIAEVELEPKYAPLASDAQAIVRTKTPLGESYVELTRGTRGAPRLPEGGRLDARNVRASQQLEAVLGIFDQPTRTAFRTLMLDVRAGLDGKAPDLNEALGPSGPTVEDLGVLAQALDAQSADVRDLVGRTGEALQAISSRPEDLRGLVRGSQSLLSATAARDAQLRRTVRTLVPFTQALTQTMPAVDHTLQLAAAYRDDFVTDFAGGAASFNYTKSAGQGGRTSRYVRGALATVPELAVGVKQRQASSRFNPYPAPGALGNLKSLVCSQVDNPQTATEAAQVDQVPCVLDAPWRFRGRDRLFPDLSPFRPAELPDP